MAKKKPLVVTNGQIEQLQAGDYIGEVDLFSKINGNAGSVVKGSPVFFTTTADTFDKARANAQGTVPCRGLLIETVATTVNGHVQGDGVLALTTAEWDAVTGQSGGLTAGSNYFLDSASAGKMTTTAPTSTGEFVQELGEAISATEFFIKLGIVIKL